MRLLDEKDWLCLEREHRELVVPWIESYRKRRERGETHPVHDFLFGYYQMNRKNLLQWRPMRDMRLRGSAAERFLKDDRYAKDETGIGLDLGKVTIKDGERIRWVKALIEASVKRPPRFNCYGLHEWAMVYRSDKVRHESTPLRLSKRAIEELLESSQVCCTHYDAYRFFTDEAKPLNSRPILREDRSQNEQFGCVHFNMDLYRWSYKLSPWIGSELMDACFRLAIAARELDMEASPYDLSQYGYEPIAIETPEGRNEYVRRQRALFERGQPLAHQLLHECRSLLETSSFQSEKESESSLAGAR